MKEKAKAKVMKWIKNRYKGYEIAAHCEVSEAIISRLINDRDPISVGSIQKIMDAKAQIGYHDKGEK